MKIRSVTYFDDPGNPVKDDFLSRAGNFARETRRHFEAAGLELQTVRFASPPFPIFLSNLPNDQIVEFAINLEKALIDHGFDYISLGPALPEKPESFSIVPELIRNTENTFCSGLMTQVEKGLSLPAVRACGGSSVSWRLWMKMGLKIFILLPWVMCPQGVHFFPQHTMMAVGPNFPLPWKGLIWQ